MKRGGCGFQGCTERGGADLFPCQMRSHVTSLVVLWVCWGMACCRRCPSRGMPGLGLTRIVELSSGIPATSGADPTALA